MLRIAVITQEDAFAVPANIEKILAMSDIEVVRVVVVDSRGSLVNRKSYFLRGFGLVQSFRMATRMFGAKLRRFLDGLTGHRAGWRRWSVQSVAKAHSLPFEQVSNVHEPVFLERLRGDELDLIVSFSAPVRFRPELLELPKAGCINLHCSHLPEYAGLLPSFWVLYDQAEQAGATVHYMDDKIDNGQILGQVRVPVDPGMTMFSLILRTKAAGGDLMCEVIRQVQQGDIRVRPNPVDEDKYHTWPTVEQMVEFRKRGGRLV